MAMESYFRDVAERQMKERPVVRDMVRDYRENELEPLLRDVFHQSFNGASKLEHDWAASTLVQLFRQGRIACCTLQTPELRGGPTIDRARETNRTAVRDLPAPFHASVTDAHGDADGQVWWDEPVDMTYVGPDGSVQWTLQPPWVAPLEIGSTSGCTSRVRMQDTAALARWPYGSDRITVLVMRPVTYFSSLAFQGLAPPAVG